MGRETHAPRDTPQIVKDGFSVHVGRSACSSGVRVSEGLFSLKTTYFTIDTSPAPQFGRGNEVPHGVQLGFSLGSSQPCGRVLRILGHRALSMQNVAKTVRTFQGTEIEHNSYRVFM
jgi:hypothetical protein